MGATSNTGSSLRIRLLVGPGAVFVALGIAVGVALYGMVQMHGAATSAHANVSEAVGQGGSGQALAKYRAEYDRLQQTYRDTRFWTGGLLGAAVLLAIGVGFYSSRAVSQPLKRLHDALRRLSEGDLTVTVEADERGNDDIAIAATLLDATVRRLRDSLQRVAETAEVVLRGSQELSAASEQLSKSAQEQASSLEETAASMEEMTSTVKHNADNAVQVDRLAAESAEAANESVTMAASLKHSMDLINSSSSKIGDIIGVIDDIAFQTNLLALNAAVEAARAGEHGRGFAVVASEVRSLAQRSAQAAKEIKGLITDSVDKVGDGAHLVGITTTKLESIVGKVKSVADLVSEINASSQEQASGIEQVNRAIVHMDGATQATAAQAEELTGTSQSLSGQADHLRRLVLNFKLPGAVAATPAAPAMPALKPVASAERAVSSASRSSARTTSDKVQVLRPRKAAGSNDDWTEF